MKLHTTYIPHLSFALTVFFVFPFYFFGILSAPTHLLHALPVILITWLLVIAAVVVFGHQVYLRTIKVFKNEDVFSPEVLKFVYEVSLKNYLVASVDIYRMEAQRITNIILEVKNGDSLHAHLKNGTVIVKKRAPKAAIVMAHVHSQEVFEDTPVLEVSADYWNQLCKSVSPLPS